MGYNYLSESERAHLKELKEFLLNSPTKYFFHRFESFQEFKQLTVTMAMWQWHYIYSMFASLIDTFKILGSAFYSIATLHFSAAAEQASDAINMALSFLLKLILIFSLFLLQTVRFSTLSATAILAPIALLGVTLIGRVNMPELSIIDSITSSVSKSLSSAQDYVSSSVSESLSSAQDYVSSFFQSPRPSKESVELYNERRELKAFHLSIAEDRERVYKAIVDFEEWMERCKAYIASRKGNKSGVDKTTSPRELLPESREFGAIFRELTLLLDSYPDFDNSMASELSYVRRMHGEFSEHHAKLMLVADEFYKKADGLKHGAYKYFKTVNSSKFFNPVGSEHGVMSAGLSPESVNQPRGVSSNTFVAR